MEDEYLQSGSLHFQPLSVPRPRGSHRFAVWSPRLNRRLIFYREEQVFSWILLESDPLVKRYCEFPYQTKLQRKLFTFDFWYQNSTDNFFLVVTSKTNQPALEDTIGNLEGFNAWASSHSIAVRYLTKEVLDEKKQYLDNWGIVLRCLTTNSRLITPQLTARIHHCIEELEEGASINSITSSASDIDPILITTTVFSLLYQGELRCPNLANTRLDLNSEFFIA